MNGQQKLVVTGIALTFVLATILSAVAQPQATTPAAPRTAAQFEDPAHAHDFHALSEFGDFSSDASTTVDRISEAERYRYVHVRLVAENGSLLASSWPGEEGTLPAPSS